QPEQKSQAPTLSTRLSISEEDALRRQISQCWNVGIGAKDADKLIVEVIIDVNPDRTVQHAEVVDQTRMMTDGYFRAAGEAALRALNNPKCSPLELPADKYDQWKKIDFTFDPRDQL
ncbi:MAG TPA: energy transducer TonB, partial [Alphaproteobacteria bacterium]|nr:energy transducer TonB [Alphaproteobacteria bacterium]